VCSLLFLLFFFSLSSILLKGLLRWCTSCRPTSSCPST
jgi:hypothetical protein